MSKSPTVLLCPHCRSRVFVDEGQAGQSLGCSCPPPSKNLENTHCSIAGSTRPSGDVHIPQADSENDPRLGSCWGPFQLVRVLGRGGMGTVFEAMDTLLERPVAIKLLTGKPGDEQVERVIREARAIAKLEHPNIVGIYQVGQQDDTYFIAMQLVNGASAGARCQSGPMPVKEASRIVLETARGLAAAHARGLVHRDIKPDNILIGADGSVKVADFGLAKEVPQVQESLLVDGKSPKSPEGVVGTPYYMSPEQAQGLSVDARADLYSLGATWFSLLTGKPLFDGKTTLDILFQHVFAPVPNLRTLRPDMPARGIAMVERLLEKNPQDRYQTATELVRNLELLLEEERVAESWPQSDSAMIRFDGNQEVRQPLPVRKWRLPARWCLAAGMVGLALGVVAIAFKRDPAPPHHESNLNTQVEAAKNTPIAEVPEVQEPVATDVEATPPAVAERKTPPPKTTLSAPDYVGVPESYYAPGGKGGSWAPGPAPVTYLHKPIPPRPLGVGKITPAPFPRGGTVGHWGHSPPTRRR